MAIDVGTACITRGDVAESGVTYVSKDNPANAIGIITSICVYSTISTLQGIEIATFSAVGNDLTTREYVTLADQGSVGEQTYTAPNDFSPFEIKTGDYIGIYFSSGYLYLDTSGGGGLWDVAGDKIPCTSETFDTGLSTCAISLYATGYQFGQINIGDVWKDVQNIKLNVGDDWKQILPESKINISDVWKDILY